FATGVVGAVLITLLAASFGVAFSGLSNTVALRTKNTESTMMVSFSLTFPLLFLSTAMLPKALLPSWVQTFSTVNPVSYMADAARALILTGYDWTALGNAFLAILAFGVVLNGLAIMALRAQGKGNARTALAAHSGPPSDRHAASADCEVLTTVGRRGQLPGC